VKLAKKLGVLSSLPAFALAFFMFSATSFAATSPVLGAASSFSILSSSYTNTATGTTINGDLGYTVGPAAAATVNGTTHMADGTYNQAGIDQSTALVALNNQSCSFNFAPGPVDLATDTTHGPIGIYTPGVYCVTGPASIGTAGITLTGGGTYVFRMNGALTSAANSVVSLASGASACEVWWTPTSATTLGANSIFAGTDISAAGITIGNLATWTGRALAFGGTVTTSRNTINTIPACSATSNTSSGNPTGGGSGGSGSSTGGTGSNSTSSNGDGTDTSGGRGADETSSMSNASATPGLPNTGGGPLANQRMHWVTIPAMLVTSLAFYVIHKQRIVRG